MAQTKKKRRTKHKGNAAGMVEVRGRTGRKPTPGEQRRAAADPKAEARQRRMERLDREPTWRSATNRAIIAAVFFAVLVVVLFKRPVGEAALLAVFLLALYIPMTFYTDRFVYRRRQKKKAEARA